MEWLLHLDIAKGLFKIPRTPVPDLHTQLNRKLSVFSSLLSGPWGAKNAFQPPWLNLNIFTFPPFCPIQKLITQLLVIPGLSWLVKGPRKLPPWPTSTTLLPVHAGTSISQMDTAKHVLLERDLSQRVLEKSTQSKSLKQLFIKQEWSNSTDRYYARDCIFGQIINQQIKFHVYLFHDKSLSVFIYRLLVNFSLKNVDPSPLPEISMFLRSFEQCCLHQELKPQARDIMLAPQTLFWPLYKP